MIHLRVKKALMVLWECESTRALRKIQTIMIMIDHPNEENEIFMSLSI